MAREPHRLENLRIFGTAALAPFLAFCGADGDGGLYGPRDAGYVSNVSKQEGRKYSAQTTADITIVSMVGALLGGLAIGFFSDKVGRKRAMVTAALGGLAVSLWIAAPNIALIVVGGFLHDILCKGMAGVIPAHMNELTPGNLRGFFPRICVPDRRTLRFDHYLTSRPSWANI